MLLTLKTKSLMKLLILGGTQFLGRHLVESGLARGHSLTLFNRGQTNPDLFPDIEKLRGDRDGNLAALRSRHWDAVIDTSGYISHKVRASAELLADAVGLYAFISSISVYSDFSRPGLDESAPLSKLAAGVTENEGDSKTYGARKALCEEAVERCLPGRTLMIRPGIIVGPHDPLDRFTYWVRRIAQGGQVLAPAPPSAPIQWIDARDLASWIVQLLEQKKIGTYNATGPERPMTFGQMLDACRAAAKSDARFTWVDEQFLLDQGVKPYSDLPLWIPQAEKAYAGHFVVDSRRAFASGLTCRPVAETAQDTLLWERQSQVPRAAKSGSNGLSSARERELLQRWAGIA